MLIHGYAQNDGALAFLRNTTELSFKIDTTTPSVPFIAKGGQNKISVFENTTPGIYDVYIDYGLKNVLFENCGISWSGAAPSGAADRLFARMRLVSIDANNVWYYQVWAQEMLAGTLAVPRDGFFVNLIVSDSGPS